MTAAEAEPMLGSGGQSEHAADLVAPRAEIRRAGLC